MLIEMCRGRYDVMSEDEVWRFMSEELMGSVGFDSDCNNSIRILLYIASYRGFPWDTTRPFTTFSLMYAVKGNMYRGNDQSNVVVRWHLPPIQTTQSPFPSYLLPILPS